jgi:hypothetical protein
MRAGLLLAITTLAIAWAGCAESNPDGDESAAPTPAGAGGSGGDSDASSAGGADGLDPASGTGGGGSAGLGGSDPGACEPNVASIQHTVFTPRCALSGCHTGDAPAAALDLSTAAISEASLIGVAAALCDRRTRVVAGDAENSLLHSKLSGTQPIDCGEPMPVGAMLSSDAIACIETWIAGIDPNHVPVMPDPNCETCGTTTCVDTATSTDHCGQCAAACPAGATCDDGMCRCPEPEILCDGQCSATCNCDGEICDGACVDTQTDPLHCGDCTTACGSGARCDSGSCACAQAGVSFSVDVAPILTSSCSQGGCHGRMAPKEGLSLTSDQAFDALVGVTAAQCSDGRQRVVAGDVANSYLIDKLLGVDLCKGTRMPKAGQGLPASDIETIAAWICNGALDD